MCPGAGGMAVYSKVGKMNVFTIKDKSYLFVGQFLPCLDNLILNCMLDIFAFDAYLYIYPYDNFTCNSITLSLIKSRNESAFLITKKAVGFK